MLALQEIGSLAGVEQFLDTTIYDIAFETRCLNNAAAFTTDVGDIYTAIAFKRDLQDAAVFQIDELAIDHESESGTSRPVRGGVGVSFMFNGQTVKVPSLHMKATCKDDRIEPDTEDDCATQRAQYDALI